MQQSKKDDIQKRLDEMEKQFHTLDEERKPLLEQQEKIANRLNQIRIQQISLQGGYRELESLTGKQKTNKVGDGEKDGAKKTPSKGNRSKPGI